MAKLKAEGSWYWTFAKRTGAGRPVLLVDLTL
jgi:hypothetical protein